MGRKTETETPVIDEITETDYAGVIDKLKDEPVATFYTEGGSTMEMSDFFDKYRHGPYEMTLLVSDVLTYEIRHVKKESAIDVLQNDTSERTSDIIDDQ